MKPFIEPFMHFSSKFRVEISTSYIYIYIYNYIYCPLYGMCFPQIFANDIALYREIISSDQELLQEDLNQVYAWSCKWLLNLNPLKCVSCINIPYSLPSTQYQLRGYHQFHNSILS